MTFVPWFCFAALTLATQPVALASPEVSTTSHVSQDATQDLPNYDWAATIVGEGPTLHADDYVQRVIEVSPSLEQAKATADVAAAVAGEVAVAFAPILDLSLGYTRLFQRNNRTFFAGLSAEEQAQLDAGVNQVADPAAQQVLRSVVAGQAAAGNASFPVIRDRYGFRAQLSYPISDVLLAVLPGYRAAKHGAKADKTLLDVEQAELRLRALQAYWGHVRARALLAVADASVGRAQSQLELAQASHRAGLASQTEVLAVQTRLAAARIAHATAEAGTASSLHALTILAHWDQVEGFAVPLDSMRAPAELTQELDRLHAQALEQRPELHALSQQREAATMQRKQAFGQALPHLAVVAGLDVARPNDRILPNRAVWNATGQVGVTLSWSPNDMARALKRKQQATAQVRAVQAGFSGMSDGVRNEVSQAFHEHHRSLTQVRLAHVGVASAQERYRSQLIRLRVGEARMSDMIDADADVTAAQTELVHATLDALLAHAALERAVGTTL